MLKEYYDPAERDKIKKQSREKDDADLAKGLVSVQELRVINSFIPPEVSRRANIISWKEME